ncbi:indole-3-glycerol phosphate synthase TrpC [uncultured Christiangramia sp.]|uniref:indole-3-glycerol phosphate synthase TrpC n=1 Tax=uncultured Christiangramia sp. TaxID=503836 RepID=UPI0026359BD7|nr:indole-3-glycerol phosphate synthase TrpC [uncultured Christiangramia sp.]
MNILDKIVADKRREVSLKKSIFPVEQLENSILFQRNPVSLADKLRNSSSGIIAEHKRRSPSKQVINHDLNVQDVASGYQDAGVCGMSVLTDGKYFGGSLEDLLYARAVVEMPVLRKDFMIDDYQILEAKAFGADVILLIAAVLPTEELKRLATFARNLRMDVLLEVHDLKELENSIEANVDMIGVNNRNLKTFEVSIQNSKDLSRHIPDEFVKVSESGISDPKVIAELKDYGYQGFLVGENFMRTEDPGRAAKDFINEINRKS